MRKVQFPENEEIARCPECGNNTDFEAFSARVSEDCCEVWVQCPCGFDPTRDESGTRLESVMGGTSVWNVRSAVVIWNESVNEINGRARKSTDEEDHELHETHED